MIKPDIIQGRPITVEDIELIRHLIATHPHWHRTQLSRELCSRWKWTDATGRVKDMACRSLLLKLQRRGRITLPQRRCSSNNHRRGKSFQPVLHDTTLITGDLTTLLPIELRIPDSGPDRSLWQTLLFLYHYLGFTTRVGHTLCYLALDALTRPVACLLFGAAAWKTAPRDRFIGWTHAQRQQHLHQVVNNMRFLIPPFVAVPHLASHVLSKATRQLPEHWRRKYGYDVCLAESFVERSRFTGACYQAANWQYLGDTRGYGRNNVHRQLRLPAKAVYVRPLCRNFRQRLTAE